MTNPNVDPIAVILAEAEANRRRERAASASANTVSVSASVGDYTVDGGGNQPGSPVLLDANGKIPSGVLYPASAGQVARTFEFQQTTPSTVWTITHNLGGYPPPVVVGADRVEMVPSVRYVDENTVVLEFGHPKTGTARLSL